MAASRPLVSIVTPTFRQGGFIERTIKSIRAQSYKNLEHIVVDGGSGDETLDVLRRNEGEYNLRWLSEPDRGMYDAINKGLAMARGEIVGYLNSDDLYFPWTVETAVSHLERFPGSAIVYGDALSISDETRAERMFFQPPFRLAYLLTIGSFAQPAVFWRRAVLEEVGMFDPELHYAGDLDFFIRATRRFGADRLDEVLAIMRTHPAMKTVTGSGPIALENAAVRRRNLGGSAPRRMAVARERARAWLARRKLWLRFASETRRPRGLERPWGHFLDAAHVRVSRPRLVLALLPKVGFRFASNVVKSSVDWLDDPASWHAVAESHGDSDSEPSGRP
jgi:GNAT superfamily N-acetyltransferase